MTNRERNSLHQTLVKVKIAQQNQKRTKIYKKKLSIKSNTKGFKINMQWRKHKFRVRLKKYKNIKTNKMRKHKRSMLRKAIQ